MAFLLLLAMIAVQPSAPQQVQLVQIASRTSPSHQSHKIGGFAVKPTQKLVTLLRPETAYAKPSRQAARLGTISFTRPLTGERTVLPLLGKWIGPNGVTWLHVRLPGRPNSHAGWIARSGTKIWKTGWRIVVNIGSRTVTVYDRGRSRAVFRAVVGSPSTPTPDGQFFVEEVMSLNAGTMGGPYALALSARSDVYSEFDGGPGQIALHSTYDIGGTLGTAESNGCVRLDPSVMSWLAARLGPGVPVTIES